MRALARLFRDPMSSVFEWVRRSALRREIHNDARDSQRGRTL